MWEAFYTGQGKKWAYLLVQVNYRLLLHFHWQLTLCHFIYDTCITLRGNLYYSATNVSRIVDVYYSYSQWCAAFQIKRWPHKNQRWKPSAAHLARGDGGELIAGCCLLLLLLFSLWGFSQSPGFFSLSIFIPDSYLLWLSFLSHSFPPCIWFLVAPKGLIYACGAAET